MVDVLEAPGVLGMLLLEVDGTMSQATREQNKRQSRRKYFIGYFIGIFGIEGFQIQDSIGRRRLGVEMLRYAQHDRVCSLVTLRAAKGLS